MKWTVEIKAKCENGKLIVLTATFNKRYQCEAYVKGASQIVTVLDYIITKK